MADSVKMREQLDEILNELQIDDLPEERLLELRKQLNPYGRTIEGSDNYLNFSFINLTEKYMQRLMMTGMIGFLNQKCDAWRVPLGHRQFPVYDYVKDNTILDEFYKSWKDDPKINEEIAFNKKMMEKRVIVKEFLEELFQYNPDAHVRSVYKPQPKDIARGIIDTPAANLAIYEFKKSNVEFREQMIEYDRIQKLIAMREVNREAQREAQREAERKANEKIVLDINERAHSKARGKAQRGSEHEVHLKDIQYGPECEVHLKDITNTLNLDYLSQPRDISSLDDNIETLIAKKIVLPNIHYANVNYSNVPEEDRNLLRTVCEMIPPEDIYYDFRLYFEEHYDKLREAVLYLYCEKPEFDVAVNPYSWHETEEEAADFQKKHSGEVIADIFTAASGKWNLVAPFKKIREAAKYFNENTAVLEEITKQIESDAKLGKDLMERKVKQRKKQNIEENGPDAEFFAQWKKQNTTLKDMNAFTNNPNNMLSPDIPDDSVQVDIFRIADTGKVEKSHFFSKAEAPVMKE
jgi:hypothetical protein